MSSATPTPEQVTLVQGLFIQNLPVLRGFVLALTGGFNLVDDVIQETFLTVTAKASDFRPGTNFRAWVFTIAKFKVLQAVSSKAKSDAEHLSPDVVEVLCADESGDKWQIEEELRLLGSCLKELAPKACQMIELRYQQAKKPGEIAEFMGWKVDAVHVALSRAREFLRDCVRRRTNADARQP